MSPAADPPFSVMAVHDAAVDGLLCGAAGWLAIPAGGDISVSWQPRKACYRVALDVVAGRPIALEHAAEWLPELAARNAGAR